MPNITGTFVAKGDVNASTYVGFSPNVEVTGALGVETGGGSTYFLTNSSSTKSGWKKLSLNASNSSKAYGSGGSHDVRPCAYGTLVCVFLGA